MLKNLDSSATEADVETQIVLPLLTDPALLSLSRESIKSKPYLPPKVIGKGSKVRTGYVPDYAIYKNGIPVAVIEAKAPDIDAGKGYDEASLYAAELNRNFPEGINPCSVILSTNGIELLAGMWDSSPYLSCEVSEVTSSSASLDALSKYFSDYNFELAAETVNALFRSKNFSRPFNQGSGPAQIISKIEQNTFAAELSPILRRYFSSRDHNDDPEIFSRAYISSNEVTSYDRNLESLLKDRIARSRDRIEVKTSKSRADDFTKKLSNLVQSRPASGDIQIVTGGVGAGKSLFARRYKELLQPASIKEKTYWSFIDFNTATENLEGIEEWICKKFIESLQKEGAPIDLRDARDQERIFANDLKDRDAYYERLEGISSGKGQLERARDIEQWRVDPIKVAAGVCRYIQGDRGECIVIVFDNVDRRDSETQLRIFQTALWFMSYTRALILLQMRDVTFENHKNEPPLDTYKTGQVFHISPPRFVDVVKRRLELSLATLSDEAPETISYTSPSGATIKYPKSRAGEFLSKIYLEVFERRSNTAQILEALAGRNVRKALDMFMAIISSGHTSEDLITGVAIGNDRKSFPEYRIIRILMRQDYRFFSESSGFISNIFYCDKNWSKPNNFLCPEILFHLNGVRKVRGDNGQMGYVAIQRILDEIGAYGYPESDILDCTRYLLERELIEADSLKTSQLSNSNCIKTTASGWAHLRILSNRIEYLAGVLPTTSISDKVFRQRIYDSMQVEHRRGYPAFKQMTQNTEYFYSYLHEQFQTLKSHPKYWDSKKNGALYILNNLESSISFAKRETSAPGTQIDWLDG